MNSYKSNILWQVGMLFISILALFAIYCSSQFSDIIKEILIGIVSGLILLLIFEIRNAIKDRTVYGYLKGEYKRAAIFESDLEKKSDTKYISMNSLYANVNSSIDFHYKGDGKYEVDAEYKEGKVKAVIYLDQINRSEGKGIYEYITKHENYTTPDIGNYTLLVDSLNYKILYIYYKNLIPNGLAEGYEIWEKIQ